MILHDLNTIFIHVPKTAGNFLTRNYLRRFSNDCFVVSGHQDGVDRFEIRGDVTTRKHMTVSEYAASVDLSETYVITTVRDPVERLISAYFSAGRRFRLTASARLVASIAALLNVDVSMGAKAYREAPLEMEPRRFEEYVQAQQCYRDYLDGYTEARGLFLLRKESPLEDLNAVLRYMGQQPFDLSGRFQRVNKADYQLSKSQMEECRQVVMASRHAEDYEYIERLRENTIELDSVGSLPGD